MVSRLRNAVAELFALPDGYEVILGNGGTTVFWDAATSGSSSRRASTSPSASSPASSPSAPQAAPFISDPTVISAPPGEAAEAVGETGIDLYALTHNETSTGVAMPIVRPTGDRRRVPWSPSTPPPPPVA